jgi:hypothetical protein
MRLALHKSLVTTTKNTLRTVKNRMQEAMKGLVVDLACASSPIQGVDSSLKSPEADFHELDDEVNSEANTGNLVAVDRLELSTPRI